MNEKDILVQAARDLIHPNPQLCIHQGTIGYIEEFFPMRENRRIKEVHVTFHYPDKSKLTWVLNFDDIELADRSNTEKLLEYQQNSSIGGIIYDEL